MKKMMFIGFMFLIMTACAHYQRVYPTETFLLVNEGRPNDVFINQLEDGLEGRRFSEIRYIMENLNGETRIMAVYKFDVMPPLNMTIKWAVVQLIDQ